MKLTNRAVYFLIGLIVLILVAGGSFYAGMVFQRTHGVIGQVRSQANTRPFAGRYPGRGLRGQSGRMFTNGTQQISGKVLSMNGSQLELQAPNGMVRTINLSNTTTYTKSGQSASQKDLVAGEDIIANLQIQNGSVNVQSIQVL